MKLKSKYIGTYVEVKHASQWFEPREVVRIIDIDDKYYKIEKVSNGDPYYAKPEELRKLVKVGGTD